MIKIKLFYKTGEVNRTLAEYLNFLILLILFVNVWQKYFSYKN